MSFAPSLSLYLNLYLQLTISSLIYSSSFFIDGETKEAFFPLTPARSETLVKRFFDTIDSPEALEALLNGKGLQIEEQSNQRREDTSTTSTSDDAVVNGDGEVVEPEMILEGITEAQVKEKNL